MIFTTGCVKTETIVEEKKIGTLPPPYLYEAETLPSVPADVPVEERAAYLLEAYASRKDVIERDHRKFERMAEWVQRIRELYPDSVVEPLQDPEPSTENP